MQQNKKQLIAIKSIEWLRIKATGVSTQIDKERADSQTNTYKKS